MTHDGMLDAKQAAAVAGVHRRTLYRWIANGLLRPRVFTPSGHPRFSRDDVLRKRRK